ncbi:hypothetical protein [Dactylosporangium sp. CA-092794]
MLIAGGWTLDLPGTWQRRAARPGPVDRPARRHRWRSMRRAAGQPRD